MPRQSKYNKGEKDNVKSYQYKAAIYIRLSVEDGDKEESNSITNEEYQKEIDAYKKLDSNEKGSENNVKS